MKKEKIHAKTVNSITQKNALKIIENNKNKIFTKEFYNEKLNNWEKASYMKNYKIQEIILNDLFVGKNKYKADIDFKIRMLDLFYSTNLKEGKGKMIRNIQKKEIMDRIEKGDKNVIKKISKVKSNKHGKKDCISFASKYCSRYNENCFPIYDKYVKQMLCLINRVTKFTAENISFSTLHDYNKYCEIVDDFIQAFYNNTGIRLNYKKFDRYIWTWAKEILYMINYRKDN